MTAMVPQLSGSAKQRWLKHLRPCRPAGLQTRSLTLVNLVNGRSAATTAEVLKVGRSTVYAVAQRCRDEVASHRNPKIGLDGMVRGQPKEVPTPGPNVPRYLAGAQDARTGEVIGVAGEKKNARWFLRLLWELTQRYRPAKVIPGILDNVSIHDTLPVRVSRTTEPGRRRLRFQPRPPYGPDDNRIERTWEDQHANGTRNHQCRDRRQLMRNVRAWLRRRNRKLAQKHKQSAA
jgi:transposase